MLRRCSSLTLLAVLILPMPWGCDSTGRQDLEYRLSTAEGERDRMRAALDDERAKVVILQERVAEQERIQAIASAEASLTRERLRQLEQNNQRLVTLLERRNGLSEQPAVPASPLPEAVDQQLQAFAKRHSGRVWYDRGRAAVSFANDRMFESGSDAIEPAAQRILGELVGITAGVPAADFEIIVVGHTDQTPISGQATLAKHPSNWHLSVHRAIAVKNVLVTAGLPESRMGVMGYAANRPLGNDPGRNRRVEVYFVRSGEVKPLPAVRTPAVSE